MMGRNDFPMPHIRVLIKFGTFLPSDDLVRILRAVDRGVISAELENLRQMRTELSDIPDHIFDAVNHRISKQKGKALLIAAARSGSIELLCAAGGLAFWILQNTIGESFKSAYTETYMHAKLKSLFKIRLNDTISLLQERIWQALHKAYRHMDEAPEINVAAEKQGGGEEISFEVNIDFSETQPLI